MAPVRVRGCAGGRAPGNTVEHLRQADARRRPNGPRKATFRRPITVRLRGKACPAEGPDVPHGREKGSSREQGRQPPQQADVGTKTRSAGRVASPHAGVVDRDGPRRACPWVLFRPLSWIGGGGAASTAPEVLFSSSKFPADPHHVLRDDHALDGYTHLQPGRETGTDQDIDGRGPARDFLPFPMTEGMQNRLGRHLRTVTR